VWHLITKEARFVHRDATFTITTMGSNDANAVFPFTFGKAAIGHGETLSMVLMSESTRTGTTTGDAHEIRSPGMPPLGELRDDILASGSLEEFIVCKPCGVPRGVTEDNMVDGATWGNGADAARLATEHDTTLTW